MDVSPAVPPVASPVAERKFQQPKMSGWETVEEKMEALEARVEQLEDRSRGGAAAQRRSDPDGLSDKLALPWRDDGNPPLGLRSSDALARREATPPKHDKTLQELLENEKQLEKRLLQIEAALSYLVADQRASAADRLENQSCWEQRFEGLRKDIERTLSAERLELQSFWEQRFTSLRTEVESCKKQCCEDELKVLDTVEAVWEKRFEALKKDTERGMDQRVMGLAAERLDLQTFWEQRFETLRRDLDTLQTLRSCESGLAVIEESEVVADDATEQKVNRTSPSHELQKRAIMQPIQLRSGAAVESVARVDARIHALAAGLREEACAQPGGDFDTPDDVVDPMEDSLRQVREEQQKQRQSPPRQNAAMTDWRWDPTYHHPAMSASERASEEDNPALDVLMAQLGRACQTRAASTVSSLDSQSSATPRPEF